MDTIFTGYRINIIVMTLKRKLLSRSFHVKSVDARYLAKVIATFIFQVRLANNTYSLDKHSLFEYETHFTVMVSG